MKKEQKLIVLLAAACGIFAAVADSTLTISPSGVTLDDVVLADGKLTADTMVDFLNADGGTLDLDGHNLTFSAAYASRFAATAQTTIRNTSATSATAAFKLTSTTTYFGAQFRSMLFDGNLKLEVRGRANSNDGFQGANNTHTGGTVLDGYFRVSDSSKPVWEDNGYPRFNTADAFGTGELVLTNGSTVFYTGSGCTFGFSSLSSAGDAGTTNYFRCPNATATLNGPLKVAAGTTFSFYSERQGNLGQAWENVETEEVLGTLLVNGRSGTFLAVHDDIPGTVALGSSDGAQLQYRGSDGIFEVGALETQGLSAYSANAYVQNTAALKTLKVGVSNIDTVFYGNIACTGSKGTKDWRLEKVGTGTLTLAGTNTYLSSTVISGGVLKLAGVGTLGAPESTAEVQFDGGTLEYGDGVTADYSSRIKSSTAAVSIDTGTNEVVFASALAASNEGGLVKKGEGTLVLGSKPEHSGKTIVSNGMLRIDGAYEYSSSDGISADVRNSFEVEDGASLEVTFRCTAASVHAGESGLLTGLPSGTTVNLANSDYRGIPRIGNVTTFSGTVNFLNALDNSGSNGAGGLLASSALLLGSESIDWGVTGEPAAAHTRIFNLEGANGMVVNLGALRQTSPNAMIYAKHRCDVNIGALGGDSIINGQFEMQDSNLLTINSVGGRLTLGENFAVLANGAAEYTRTPILNITAGTIENNADLSGFSVNLSDGVTICGTGTWPTGVTMPAGYAVLVVLGTTTVLNGIDVDFAHGASLEFADLDPVSLDREQTYTLLSAKSVAGVSAVSLPPGINEGEVKGSWRLSAIGSSVVLRYQKKGFRLSFR